MSVLTRLPSCARPPSQSGFTLIEMMIVVVIIAILATIAVPSVDRLLKVQRNKEVVQILFDSMREARTESLLRRQPIRVSLSDGVVSIMAVGGGSTGATIRQYRWNNQKTPVTATSASIDFQPNKTVSFATGTSQTYTTYCSQGEIGRTVTVNANGNVSIDNRGSKC